MQVLVQLPDNPRQRWLRMRAERTLRSALERHAGRVERVWLRVTDQNGPRGGLDQRCLLRVAVKGGADVVVEGIYDDPRHGFADVAERASRVLARRAGRTRASFASAAARAR